MKTIAKNIYHAGYIKEAGAANSYFIKGEGGSANWLVNAPEPTAEVLKELEELGGVDYIFGTHRDVVCHADAVAKHFNAKRVFHELDLDAMPDTEIVLKGEQKQTLAGDDKFVAMPAPGHTEGHCVLLYAGSLLFCGDAFSVAGDKVIVGPAEWTWQSTEMNIETVKRLASLTLTCVLPDHGQCLLLDPEEIQKRILKAVESACTAAVDPAERIRALNIYIGEMRDLGQTVQLNKMLLELSKVAGN
jgi:glyoxylase-like metal-dependent hydrolase (beta-lactamase superfamily II)